MLRSRSGALVAIGLALLLGWRTPSRADVEEDRVPHQNRSYVPSDAAWLHQSMSRAQTAAERGDWSSAVRLWQDVVETREDKEAPGSAAPYLVAVYGSVVYEGAWIVAHHRILAGGPEALEAYATEYGAAARKLFARATAHRSPALLAEVAERFLPLPEGRQALLLLADLALERGAPDEALGWLDRLEDVEAVSAQPDEQLAPWRRARVLRVATALARPERVADAAASLERSAAPGTPAAERFRSIEPADRRSTPPPVAWTTTGGDARRAAVPAALGAKLVPAWWRNLNAGAIDPEVPGRLDPSRPSPWLPPRAVVDWPHAFVSDGLSIDVWDLSSGRRVARPYPLRNDYGRTLPLQGVLESEARDGLGLLEGFSLTLGRKEAKRRILYVAVPDPETGPTLEVWGWTEDRDDHLEALSWDGFQLAPLWRVGGSVPHGGMPATTRVYGAPLLYRDRLWIVGVRPTRGSDVQADVWLFGLAPATGEVEVRTYLGAGSPVRNGRSDEAIPSSPAGAHGRVVVVTGLGIVASVDARTGRPHWVYLNDRGAVAAGRQYRLGSEPDATPRESGFKNQPPLLAFERVYIAPTDGPNLCCLFDRPRGRDRTLRSRRRHRLADFPRFAAEQVVGLEPGDGERPPILVIVGTGQAAEGQPPAPMAVGLDPLTLAWRGWRGISPTGHGPEPYGEALVTRGEVYVPTRHGVAVYGLRRGRLTGILDATALPESWWAEMPPFAVPFGNVVPVPGRGILTLNGALAVFWR